MNVRFSSSTFVLLTFVFQFRHICIRFPSSTFVSFSSLERLETSEPGNWVEGDFCQDAWARSCEKMASPSARETFLDRVQSFMEIGEQVASHLFKQTKLLVQVGGLNTLFEEERVLFMA